MIKNEKQFKVDQLTPVPKDLRPEHEIMATWKGNIDKPLVSINCAAYNHEPYIMEALNGFLMQETNFPFEILVHDDASTDKTADIIRNFEARYPKIVKPIYQNENQYSKGVKPSAILYPLYCGKYIALCEGDDYWIDPLKIQKQVYFLENNPDYGLVHGNNHNYNQMKDEWFYNALNSINNLKNKKNLSPAELFNYLIEGTYKITTATVVFRKELLDLRIPDNEKFKMGDTPMWLDFSQFTKFKFIDEALTVYRITPDSASRPSDRKKRTRFVLSMREMRIYYSKKHNYPITEKLKKKYNKALLIHKVYDPSYKEKYKLYNPTFYQNFLSILLNNKIFKLVFLKNNYTVKFVNKFIVRGYS